MNNRTRCRSAAAVPLSLLMILLLAAASLIGCGKDGTDRGELILLCGSSFVRPMERLTAEFEAETGIKVVPTVAGSENFLPLVEAGNRGDLLLTHDPYLAFVADAGKLAGHVRAGYLAPVLAVRKGNPKGVREIADLARPGLAVALSNPEYSTCGEMVAALLEKKGLKSGVMTNVDTRLTKGHAELGLFLKTGTVDAVIMWNGVARSFREAVDVVPTPYEYDDEIGVHIIGLSYSSHPSLVIRFLDFSARRAPAIFSDEGYVK
jgi:molybdate transport system substrate-binding protein